MDVKWRGTRGASLGSLLSIFHPPFSMLHFASTCSVNGASDQTLDERSALHPVSLYARSKIDSERVLLALNDDRFAPVILRFGAVYGLSPRPRFDLVIGLGSTFCLESEFCTANNLIKGTNL